MPSRAEEWFNSLPSDEQEASEFLQALVGSSPPTTEEEWIDFKNGRSGKDDSAIADSEIKKIWAEALSGYGTTCDGLLVWGISARKNEDDIDCVEGISTVTDVNKVKSRLQELHSSMVDPPLPGVEIRAIRLDPTDSSPEGFVVCLIREGGSKPYRNEAKKTFHIRAGDSFHICPTTVLRSLFFPQKSMRLEVLAEEINEGHWGTQGSRNYWHRTIRLVVMNTGDWTISGLSIVWKKSSHNPRSGSLGPSPVRLTHWETKLPLTEVSHVDLHPRQEALIGQFTFATNRDDSVPINQSHGNGPPETIEQIAMSFECYGHDVESQRINLSI